MAVPPTLFGYVPLKAPRVDPRWLAVKDHLITRRYTRPAIELVDRWVNCAIRYQADKGDDWAPPATTFARRFGDCEDIALLKRAILLRSGVPEDQIFFVLVRDLILKADHAILVARDDRDWRVLDSFNALTLPVTGVQDYRPILAFSGASAWLYGRKRP